MEEEEKEEERARKLAVVLLFQKRRAKYLFGAFLLVWLSCQKRHTKNLLYCVATGRTARIC